MAIEESCSVSCVVRLGDRKGGCVGRRQPLVHKWREQSKINVLTHGIHNPVKQRSPNNLLSVSYRPVQMSMSLRAGFLAEPLSANVVSSLQDWDLHCADKGSAHGGAQRWIREVLTSEQLPVTWLPPSPSDLSRVASLWAATCTSLSPQTDLVLCVLVPCASEVFAVTTHVPRQQAQLP